MWLLWRRCGAQANLAGNCAGVCLLNTWFGTSPYL